MTRNVERDLGVTLVVPREELAELMNRRAEAHVGRAEVQAGRTKKLAELVGKSAALAVDEVRSTPAIADEEDNGGSSGIPDGGRFVDLSNSSRNDIASHVLYARDRGRAHRKAAEWLRFAVTHLDRERYEFGTDDGFLAYLVDVDHPTAMPVSWFQTHGVQ